jgi:hypothetical protein
MSLRDNGQGADYLPTSPALFGKSEEPKPSRSVEGKVAGKFLEGINTLTFDASVVAMAFALAPVSLQIRLMDIFRRWIDCLEAEYDRDVHQNNDHLELQVMAKRLNEGMLPYEE